MTLLRLVSASIPEKLAKLDVLKKLNVFTKLCSPNIQGIS